MLFYIKNISKFLSVSLFSFLLGCVIADDVSHTQEYNTLVGKKGYLIEERCLYYAEPGQFSFEENILEGVVSAKSEVCIEDSPEDDYLAPIEVLPIGTPITFLKTLRRKNKEDQMMDYVIGVVYSKTQKKQMRFEYVINPENSKIILPWSLIPPKKDNVSLKT
ncbi:MAG: hypothetical protein V4629_13890 [Pseudomonadota bacterium]